MNKLCYFVLTFILCLNMSIAANADENKPQVNALSAVLIDGESGRVLWGKDCEKPMAMASTTKIMTAIIALENSNLNEIVTVSQNAVLAPPVKMHLVKGEELTLEQLLYALLMQSSNDAAVAIAEHVGGSVENFATMMNNKAKEIGCSDTEFVTPNGLDKGNHHSTAKDMALIGAYAIKNKEFIRISNTKSIAFSSNKKSYSITNKNQLLSTYNGAIGVKTGFTGKAGHCFVGAAKRGDITLVSVVLASGWGSSGKAKKWSDTVKILNYGFDNYKKYSIMGEDKNVSVNVSKKKQVTLKPIGNITALLTENEYKSLSYNYKLPTSIEAPVYNGREYGKVDITVGDIKLGSLPMVSPEDIPRHSFGTSIDKIIRDWIKILC